MEDCKQRNSNRINTRVIVKNIQEKKEKSPMRSVCCMCAIAILMSLFFFGGLIPVIIGGLIALPCMYLMARKSSKKKQMKAANLNSSSQTQSITTQAPVTANFCPECGSPVEGNFCGGCGKHF